MEITYSNQGKPKIGFDGYEFTKQYSLKNGNIRWQCSKKSKDCYGALKTDANKQNPEHVDVHNHPPNQDKIAANRVINTMKVAAKAGRAEPIQIYADAIEDTPAAVRQYLPN